MKMRQFASLRRKQRYALLIAASAATIMSSGAFAQTYVGGNLSWNNTASWTPSTIPNATSASVNFLSPAAAQTTTLSSGVTVGIINFDYSGAASTFGTTISGSAITLNNGGGGTAAQFNVLGGSNATGNNVVSSSLTFAASTPWNITNNGNAGTTTLTFQSGTLVGGTNPIVVDGSSNTTIAQSIPSTFTTLTKNGTGTLTLSNTNGSYTGNTTVNDGTIAVSGGSLNVLGGSGSTLVLAGGRLQVTATASGIRNLTMNANSSIDVTGSASATFSSSSTLSLSDKVLTKTGTGTLVFSNAATSSANSRLDINAGQFTFGTSNALGANATVNLGDTSGSATATLSVGNLSVSNPITVRSGSSGTKTITFSTGTGAALSSVAVNDSVTFSIASSITGAVTSLGGSSTSAVLTKSGAGTLTLSGANGFSGTTQISAGRINFNATDVVGATAANTITINPTGAVTLASNGTASVTLNNNIVMTTGSATPDIFASGSTGTIFTLAGSITGAGPLTRGAGGGGQLVALTGDASGWSGNLAVVNNPIFMNSSALSFTGNLNIGNGTSNTVTFLSNGTITKALGTGASQVQLTSAATSGPVIAARGGDLMLNFGSGSNLTWGSGGFLASSGLSFGDSTFGTAHKVTLQNNIDANSTGSAVTRTITVNANSAILSGNLTQSGAGVVSFSKLGTGTLELRGTNTFGGATGGITVSAGILQFSSDANLGSTGTPLTASAGLIQFIGGTDQTVARPITTFASGLSGAFDVASPRTLTLSGVISSSGGIYKSGTGDLALTNTTNFFTGSINVSNGSLFFVNGGLGSPTGTSNTVTLGTATTTGTLVYNGTGDSTINRTSTTANITLGGVGGGVIKNQSPGTTLTVSGAGTNSVGGTGFPITFGGAGNITVTKPIATGTNGTVIKNDGGTLTLSGTNTYTGGTTISGGSVVANNVQALGTSASTTTFTNSASLEYRLDSGTWIANPRAIGSNSVTLKSGRATSGAGVVHVVGGASTIAAGSITLDVGANVTADTPYGLTLAALTLSGDPTFTVNSNGVGVGTLTLGAIGETGGSRSITKSGAGTLVFSAAGTYTGTTKLQDGAIVATAAGAFGTAGSVSFDAAGKTLEFRSNFGTTYTTGLSIGGNSSTLLVGRTTSGTGVTHTAGATSVGTATLSLGVGSNVTTGSIYGLTLGATTLSGNPTFDVANNGASVGTLTLGAIADGGTARTITKSGAGTLNLAAAASSVSAGTSVLVNTGTLNLANATALGTAAADVTAASGTTVSSTAGAASVRNLTLNNGSQLNVASTGAGLIINGTYSEPTSPTATWNVTNSNVNNTNSYDTQGLQFRSGGTVTVASNVNANAAGNSFGIVGAGNGTTVNLNGAIDVGLTGSGSIGLAAYGNGTLNVGSTSKLDAYRTVGSSGNFHIRGDGTGTVAFDAGFVNLDTTDSLVRGFGIARIGGATMVTNAAQNLSGGSVYFAFAGPTSTWSVRSADQAHSGDVQVQQNGTIDTQANLSLTNSGIGLSITSGMTLTKTGNTNLTVAGTTALNGGTLSNTSSGSVSLGTTTATAGAVISNTGAGQISVNGLTPAGNMSISGTGGVAITNAAIPNVTVTADASSGANSLSGELTGTTVSNTGTGTLNLSDLSVGGSVTLDNASSGAVNVGGTVKLKTGSVAILNLTGTSGPTFNASIDLRNTTDSLQIQRNSAPEAVTIDSGKFLAGTGFLYADTVTIANGGELRPGNSPGTLLVDGDVIFDDAGVYEWELTAGAGGTAGTDWDLLSIGGNLDVQSTSIAPFVIKVTAGSLSGWDNSNGSQTWNIASTYGIANFAANKFFVDTTSFSNSLGGGNFVVKTDDLSGQYLQLAFVPAPVPEMSVLLGALPCLTLGMLRRRRSV